MWDVTVSHYLCSTRTKDPGSYRLAWIGVRAGSPPPDLPLGRRSLATDCGGTDRQLRSLSDCLENRCADLQPFGYMDDCGVRMLRVPGLIRARERLLIRTATLGEDCLSDRRSGHRNWWVYGRASACGDDRCHAAVRWRWAGSVSGGVADRRRCFARSRSTGKAKAAGGGTRHEPQFRGCHAWTLTITACVSWWNGPRPELAFGEHDEVGHAVGDDVALTSAP